MNPTHIAPCSIAGLAAGRSFRPQPLPSSPPLSRAGLPVVSHRPFLSGWMTRGRSLAAARLGKLR